MHHPLEISQSQKDYSPLVKSLVLLEPPSQHKANCSLTGDLPQPSRAASLSTPSLLSYFLVLNELPSSLSSQLEPFIAIKSLLGSFPPTFSFLVLSHVSRTHVLISTPTFLHSLSSLIQHSLYLFPLSMIPASPLLCSISYSSTTFWHPLHLAKQRTTLSPSFFCRGRGAGAGGRLVSSEL